MCLKISSFDLFFKVNFTEIRILAWLYFLSAIWRMTLSSLFLKFIYLFQLEANYFKYCGGFCHTSTWIAMGVHVSHHPEPPSSLPPHPIPLGCSRAPALRILLHALNLHWSSVSHMVMYMFQCYSLKSSHPRLLPLSTKSVLYTCVSFVALHVGSLVPSF